MELVKAVVEEVKCISGYPHVAQNRENNLCGGCCEGTVFTFTSAASNGKLRQRLRSRASILKAHGRQEAGRDPVFTEMRMMPPKRETTSADFIPSAAKPCKPTFPHNGACGNQVTAHNSADHTQPVERQTSAKYFGRGEESESRSTLEQPENVEDEVKDITNSRDEDYSESTTGTVEELRKQDRGTRENNSDGESIHQTGSTRVQHQEAFTNDRRINQKRCCSGEHFNQRKLSRTGHTEQTLPASSIDGLREELRCKRKIQVGRTELKVDSFAESNDRLQIEAELKNLQARQHVTGVKWTMMRRRLPDQEPPVVEDLDTAVSADTTSEVVREKESQEKENGHGSLITSGFASSRAEHVFPLKGPFACSSAPSKGGGPRLEGKTFSFGGDSFVRAESSAQNSERTLTYMKTVSSTKDFACEPVGTVEAGHLQQALGIFRARSGSPLGKISEVTGDTKLETTQTVEAGATIKGNLSVPVESFSCTKDLAGIEKATENVVNLPDCETGNSSNIVQALSSSLSHSSSGDLAECSEELEEGSSTSEEQGCSWLAVSEKPTVGHPLHDDSGSILKECPTQRSRQIRPVVNRGLSSVSLVNEWSGSTRSENSDRDSCSDNDSQHFEDRGDEGDFFPRDTQSFRPLYEEEDNASPISSDGTLCRWEDNGEDENQKENCDHEVNSEKSSLDTELKEDENRTALDGDIILMNMNSIEESNVMVNQESFCVEKEDLKSRLNTHRSSRPKCDSGCATKAGLPIRRRAWRRSFKRKKNTSAEGFNNLEKWLGRERSKRKASLNGRFSDSGVIRNRISLDEKHHLLLALQAVQMPGALPACRTRERSITSSASLSSDDEVHANFERSETPGSAAQSDFCGESNTSEILDSNLVENCNGGHLTSCPVSSEDFDHDHETSSNALNREECLDFTQSGTTLEDSFSDQQCVNPDVKCTFSIKIGSRTSETASVPTNPTNFITSHAAMNAGSKHSTYQSDTGSNISTGRNSEVKAKVNSTQEETFLGAPKENCDSLHVRSQMASRRHQDLSRGPEDRSRNDSPCWTVVTSSGCSLEESLTNEEGNQVCVNGNSDDLVKTRTLAGFFKENTDLSLFTPQNSCRVEDRKGLVSRTIPPSASGKNGSRPSSDNCSLDNSAVANRFGTDYTSLALVGAGCRRAVEASDIPKPAISKKPKIPIVVRVRNGLATGWLLQSFIWKKFGKQKLKSCDPQSVHSEAISRKDTSDSRLSSNGGSASPRVVSDLWPSLSSRPRGSEERSWKSCDASTTRKDKTYGAKDNATEDSGAAAPATPAGEDIIITETVRSTPTTSEKSTGLESCYNEGESDSARYCDGRRQDAREETAGLRRRDLHRQSSGNLRGSEAGETFEPEGEGNVWREHGRSAQLGVHASNQSSLAVDSVAVRFVTNGSFVSDASGGDILGEAHSVERIHEQPANRLRCELRSEKEIYPPSPANSAIPEHTLDKNVLCPVSAQDPLSGGAVSTKNVEAPVIWRSKDASSASQRAECEGQVIAHCGSKTEASTPQEEDNDISKSTASSGFVVLLDTEEGTQSSKDVSVKVDQISTRDTGNKSPLPPLDERNGFLSSELLEAEDRCDEVFRSRQQETLERRLEKAAPLAQSVLSSSRNVDSVDTDRIKAGTSCVWRRTPRSFKKKVPGCQREEHTVTQTQSTRQPTVFSQKIPVGPKSNKFESTNAEKTTEHYGLSTHDEPKPGTPNWCLSQGREVNLQGQISEKGIANTGVKTAPAALQSCRAYHPPSLQWIPVGTREAQGTVNPHGERIPSCQSQFVESIPWNEPQESSADLTSLGCRRLDDSGLVKVLPEVWNLKSQTDFRSFDHANRKEELHGDASIDCHGQEEVFLERFSSSKDSQKNYSHQRSASSGDLAARGAPAVPGATSYSNRSGPFRPEDKGIPAEQTSLAVNREVEPSVLRGLSSRLASPLTGPPAPLPIQTLHSSQSNILPLPYEPDRAHSSSSNGIFSTTCHTCESAVPEEIRNSSVTPLFSVNEYSESNPEKFAFKPKLCSHGSMGSGAWEHQLDDAADFRAFPTQTNSQWVPSPLPPSLVHNPTLALNSKKFCSSCRTAQPFYDTCNFGSCSKSSCNQQSQVRGAMPPGRQCLCESDHILGMHSPAYALACPAETARSRHMGAQVSNDHGNQHAFKAGRYAPPQSLPLRQPAWPVPEKNNYVETIMPGDCELQDCTSLHGKEQDSGLVWLTGEEMNVIRELRHSGGKDSIKSSEFLADPEPSHITSAGTWFREGSFCGGGSNISHTSSISRCSNYSTCISPRQINETGNTRQTEFTRDSLLKRWITSMQKAASTIQRAWRALSKRRKEIKISSVEALPRNMKDFYELIKTRLSSTTHHPPSFDGFVKSIKYIQARTEGVRVRRRLKSRRLQSIIMEIKEIRNLVSEMSEESNRDASAPYLYPQLCNQLHQKILQLHTALTGPQMQARFLLKRGPATPLVMYPTNPPAAIPSSVAGNAVTSTRHETEDQLRPRLPRRLSVLPECNTVHSQAVMSRRQSSSRGKGRPPAVKSRNSLTDPPESSELLPWYVLAQRSPSHQTAARYRSSPTEFTSSLHESHTNKASDDTVSIRSRSSDTANKETSQFEHDPRKTVSANSSFNEIYEEQRRRRNFAFDEVPIGTASANMFNDNLGSSVDLPEKPKRPFLKRKSVIMPPQKLDWSKVKPMVSSRLEPELKTKLSYGRSTKAVDRHTVSSNSRRRKEKYSQVKSRLFSYEGNVSPGSSKETVPRGRYNEHEDTDTASGSRGSESGESSRLAALRRPASPDLLRLKSQVQADTEAELVYRRVQASIMDPQFEPTYSARFDSARYLHKLETSSKASKDSSIMQGPQPQPQPRTQRIRLRLIPGSEENEPGRVLVQKVEAQEEEMPDLWHQQRVAMTRRRQSHSHRYASYRESSQLQVDAQLDDSARPRSPPDQRTLKTSASSKMGLASKELEDMFERVIAAKCGRNMTLSDIFEQSSSQSRGEDGPDTDLQ